jgi:hypothetical protein
VRRATGLGLLFLALGACTDLRDYRGTWSGRSPTPGIAGTTATLSIDQIDTTGMTGAISLRGNGLTITDAALRTSQLIAADALSTMTFAGSPLHVYLAYFDAGDACGDVLAVVSLYESHRVELRVLRGANQAMAPSCAELYGTFSLTEGAP